MVGALNKEFAAIIIDKIDRFRIIRVFINAFSHISRHHVVKHLKNISKYPGRIHGHDFGEILKGNGAALILFADDFIQVPKGKFDFFHVLT
jgi:hypothetical protein